MVDVVVHRRENIVWSAIDQIHENGIYLVSTKEIARRLGIAESTIFKHFPKKNDLLLAALEQFALYDSDLFRTASTKSPAEALTFYFQAYLTYYENYPAITALLQAYELLRGVPELEEKARAIQLARYEHMRRLIEIAQAGGVICGQRSAETLDDIFISAFYGMVVKWRLSDFSFPLREETMQVMTMLVAAFGPKNPG